MTRTERQQASRTHECVVLTHEEETKSSTRITSRLEEDLRKRLTSDVVEDGGEITEGAHDDSQKDETKGAA